VGLHIVFASMAAHDKYQDIQAQGIHRENKEGWKKVRVFDTVVEK